MNDHLTSVLDFERCRAYVRLLVRGIVPRCLNGRMDESDIVQDVMLRVFESRHQLQARCEAQLAAWLRSILKSTMLEAIRKHTSLKRSVWRERQLDGLLDGSTANFGALIDAFGQTPDHEVDVAERMMQVVERLFDLPEAQLDVLLCTFLDQQTDREIAAALGRSVLAVSSLRRRGLEYLREVLDRSPRRSDS